ncbi:hypothetical protein, partial [uncultured Duncaniella sp.]|uniref:hypothetical protein n=1 Tax=uncultured Duncaniella sp. TaxID=2768039 RepID=UPI0026E589E2
MILVIKHMYLKIGANLRPFFELQKFFAKNFTFIATFLTFHTVGVTIQPKNRYAGMARLYQT